MRCFAELFLRNVRRLVNNQIRNNSALSHVNRFTFREYNCGDISQHSLGKKVNLYGWIKHKREQGKNLTFLTLTDAYGTVQLLVRDICSEVPKQGSVIMISGKVEKRPPKDVNPLMKSGQIEIHVQDLKVLSANENVSATEHANDPRFLQTYRYIDLRTERLQRNLRFKSQFLMDVRNYLCQEGFVEIETPVLQKITPGGAHEFIVPTYYEDEYYCLGQSPQIYKQLCMIGGCDRYFQVAKCFRNETGRADRQPEFLQIDMEMSFTTRDGIIDLIENLLLNTWPTFLDPISIPFPRINYNEAMQKYGSDKPDLRSDVELKDLVCNINGIDKSMTAFVFPIGNEINHAKGLDKLIYDEFIRNQFKEEAIVCGYQYNGCIEFNSQSSISLSDSAKDSIKNNLALKDFDYLLLATGRKTSRRKLMGILRNAAIDYMVNNNIIDLKKEGKHSFSLLWVIDCPMFSLNEITGQLECNHHPFTAPRPDQVDQIYSDPLSVISNQFDIVLNGVEIGGGSMRITCPNLQEYIFTHVLKEDPSSMSFFFKALASGCPPHGGLAIGVDRLLHILLKTDTIRDFIAFPKAGNCRDRLSLAPSIIPESLKKLYHLK